MITFAPGQVIVGRNDTLFLVLKCHKNESVDLLRNDGKYFERQRLIFPYTIFSS